MYTNPALAKFHAKLVEDVQCITGIIKPEWQAFKIEDLLQIFYLYATGAGASELNYHLITARNREFMTLQ